MTTPQILASIAKAVGEEDHTTDHPEELVASSSAYLAPATTSVAPSPAATGLPFEATSLLRLHLAFGAQAQLL